MKSLLSSTFKASSYFILSTLMIAYGPASSQAVAGTLVLSEQQAREQLRLGLVEESAETYARIGETLLDAESIYYAQLMFEKALQLDANNLRANFYSAFVGPLSQLRGFGQRTEEYFRLQRQSSGQGSGLNRVIDELDLDEIEDGTLRDVRYSVDFGLNYPGTNLNRFLMENSGKPQIRNHEQLRQYLQNELLAAMEKGIERLKKVSGKTQDLKLYLTNTRVAGLPGFNFSVRPLGFETECFYDYDTRSMVCRSQEVVPYTVQEAQLQGALLAYDYYIQLSRLFTAYKLEGYEAISSRLAAAGSASGNVQYRRFISLASRFPSFLTLDAASKLSEIMGASRAILTRLFEMGSEAGVLCSGNWNQFALCQLVREFDAFLALEKLVQGEVTLLIGYDVRYQPVRIKMNAPAWFAKPTADLKRLLPRVGDLDQLPDPTLGGLFPNGDLPAKIKMTVYSVQWTIE